MGWILDKINLRNAPFLYVLWILYKIIVEDRLYYESTVSLQDSCDKFLDFFESAFFLEMQFASQEISCVFSLADGIHYSVVFLLCLLGITELKLILSFSSSYFLKKDMFSSVLASIHITQTHVLTSLLGPHFIFVFFFSTSCYIIYHLYFLFCSLLWPLY